MINAKGSFVCKVQKQFRVKILKGMVHALEIKEGDRIKVTLEKPKKAKA
jgi:hypothetical protein